MSTRQTMIFEEWGLNDFLTHVRASDLEFDIGVNDGPVAATIERNGKRYLSFCNINFLSLTDLPVVKQAFWEGVEKYGFVTGGSRNTIGIPRIHAKLEDMLNSTLQKSKSLLFMTGWLANEGFASCMNMKVCFSKKAYLNNSDVAVLLDSDSHRSILDSFGKRENALLFFHHNDVNHLEHLLKKTTTKKKLVIFESAYSADGSIAPIKDIIDVCTRYGAVSFVDNANGFLVYGAPNRPFYNEFQHLHLADFEMVSFSKAVGLEGGAVGGEQEFMNFMQLAAPTSLFTAMIQPPTAMAILKVLELTRDHPEYIDDYLRFIDEFRASLLENNFVISRTPSYMISIFVGKDRDAVNLEQWLKKEKDILVPVFRYPAVKRNQAILRIIPSRCHTHADVSRLIDALNEANEFLSFKNSEYSSSEFMALRQ